MLKFSVLASRIFRSERFFFVPVEFFLHWFFLERGLFLMRNVDRKELRDYSINFIQTFDNRSSEFVYVLQLS